MTNTSKNINQIETAMKFNNTVFFHYSSRNSTDDSRLEVLPLALVTGGNFQDQLLAIRVINGKFEMRRYNLNSILDDVVVSDSPAYNEEEWKEAYLEKDKFFVKEMEAAINCMTWWDASDSGCEGNVPNIDESKITASFVRLNGGSESFLLWKLSGKTSAVTCVKGAVMSHSLDKELSPKMFTHLENDMGDFNVVEGMPLRFHKSLGPYWKKIEPVVNVVSEKDNTVSLFMLNENNLREMSFQGMILPLDFVKKWLVPYSAKDSEKGKSKSEKLETGDSRWV